MVKRNPQRATMLRLRKRILHDPLVSGFFLESVLPPLYTSMKAFRTQWEDSRRARHIAGDPVCSAISSMKCVPRVDAVAQRTGRMTGRQPCSPATKKPAISGQQRLQSVLCSLDSVDNSISPPRRDRAVIFVGSSTPISSRKSSARCICTTEDRIDPQ